MKEDLPVLTDIVMVKIGSFFFFFLNFQFGIDIMKLHRGYGFIVLFEFFHLVTTERGTYYIIISGFLPRQANF